MRHYRVPARGITLLRTGTPHPRAAACDDDRATRPDPPPRRPPRAVRRGMQAAQRMAHRAGDGEVRDLREDARAAPVPRRAQRAPCPRGPRCRARAGRRSASTKAGLSSRSCEAGRPSRSSRARSSSSPAQGREHSPGLRRAARAPARDRPPVARHGRALARRRFSSVRASRGLRVGPEAALRHHARVPAHARRARARHDAAHLHGAGEPRLRERGRRDAQDARRARALAGDHGDVREQPVERGPASRRGDVSRPRLARRRPRSLWTRARSVEARQPLRRLHRVGARRAHVPLQARRPRDRRTRARRSAPS